MRITCIQMDVAFARPEENFRQAEALVRQAAKTEQPDVILLPELWNTGFFPKEGLSGLADPEGRRTAALCGGLARELGVNLVAGSVACLRAGKLYNTAMAFDRQGSLVDSYDKTHLFSPMEEDVYFQAGDHLSVFSLDGTPCGLLICYDLRFPELTRTLALQGIQVLFLAAQWPVQRAGHLRLLYEARAVENQMFVACCNACGQDDAGNRFGGNSGLVDPWGTVLARAGEGPCFLSGDCDLSITAGIRAGINVFRDRRPALYHCS